MVNDFMDKPSQCTREVLVEQILWLIKLRWIAIGVILAATLLGSYVFPVLTAPNMIYICAVVLLICNVVYFFIATGKPEDAKPGNLIFGLVQVEVDLFVLTVILNFSGGVVNPFFLFYIFHVIIAAIILPRSLSFAVGLTAILCFGLLEVNEFHGGAFLGYYPLRLSTAGGLWRNPVYALGVFAAFSFTVVLVQYLTRMILLRMTAKELEAARNGDMLKAVIHAMSEGLIFVNSDGSMAICNPAAMLWKENHAEGESRRDDESFPGPLAEMLKHIISSDDKSDTVSGTITFETSGPVKKYVEARCCPVVSIHGNRLGHVIVGQDLTEHKKIESYLREKTEEVTNVNELLRMSRIEIAQREKMVAIGQMATGIAHEIGNPLASISSVAQYLVRKLTMHEHKEQLLVIQYHINRISNILKRMLSLSRPATSEYKWSDINSLIDNTLSLISYDKRARAVSIKSNINPDLPMVWLNPQYFEQVLLNIFINALDAMNVKKDEQDRLLTISRKYDDGIIEIRISDTGIGMNPEVCRRAFESFFTTKEIGQGTGMGLYISYNLVAEVDGTLELESEPGKGTTVIIKIPLRPKNAIIRSEDAENGFSNMAKAV
jgi:signal transduction histidine kinase